MNQNHSSADYFLSAETRKLKNLLRQSRLLQILLLISLWLIGQEICILAKIPLPGSIVGLILLLLLIFFKKNSIKNFELGAKFLLADMPLFFVPAVLAFVNHPEFLGITGIKILAIIIIGTTTVLVSTALMVDFLYNKTQR